MTADERGYVQIEILIYLRVSAFDCGRSSSFELYAAKISYYFISGPHHGPAWRIIACIGDTGGGG